MKMDHAGPAGGRKGIMGKQLAPGRSQDDSGSPPPGGGRERDGGRPFLGSVAIRGAVKRHGSVTVLHGVDLEIHAGEFFVLLGPSGSGKTTTLRILAGLESVNDGRVFMDGADVAGPSRDKRREHARPRRPQIDEDPEIERVLIDALGGLERRRAFRIGANRRLQLRA